MSELTLLAPPQRDRLNRRVRHLAWATIGYNAAEGIVALTAGVAASSTALVSFGLDSTIEVSSALAVAWQFAGHTPAARERRTLRLIALSFFALAAWVTIDSLRSLLGAEPAAPSGVGIALTAASLVVMPALTLAKRRTGRALGSATVAADSTQTLLCTYLSAVVLAGLALNASFGWSWADPIAALVVAVIATREGIETWRGEACCPPPTTTQPGGTHGDFQGGHAHSCGCGPGCTDGCAQVPPSHPNDRRGREGRISTA